MKPRYQSTAITGLPAGVIASERSQNSRRAAPLPTQAGSVTLWLAASIQAQPSHSRARAQSQARCVLENRYRAIGGSPITTLPRGSTVFPRFFILGLPSSPPPGGSLFLRPHGAMVRLARALRRVNAAKTP